MQSKRRRNRKITLIFDEEKRREFLGGFRKRKLERKRKAQEQLQKQLKEEQKKIKQEMRERYAKSLSNRTVPELEELLSHHEYEYESHTVSILEVNLGDLKERNKWIGENKIVEENEEEKDNIKEYSNDGTDEIMGMSLQEKQDIEQKLKSDKQLKKSLKELKQEIKRTTLKQVKNSKIFQQKQRIEKQKNKKNKQRSQKSSKKFQKSSKNKK